MPDTAATEPAPPPEEPKGLLDRVGDFRVDLEALYRQLPGAAAVADGERVAQRAQQLRADRLFGFRGAHAADVDAAHRDALGDLVVLRAVVGVGADRAEHEDDHTGDDRDFRLTSQQRSSTTYRNTPNCLRKF